MKDAKLTAMAEGERRFRTEEQMRFLNQWILRYCGGKG